MKKGLISSILLVISLLFAYPVMASWTEPPVSENCNRVESPLSTNWSGPVLATDTGTIQSDGSVCKRSSTGTNGSSWYNATQYGPQVVSVGEYAAVGGGNRWEAWIKIVNPGQANLTTGYRCRAVASTTAPVVLLSRLDPGSSNPVDISAEVAATFVAGTKFACAYENDELSVWTKQPTGSWEKKIGVIDTTYRSQSGYIGFRVNGTTDTLNSLAWASVGCPVFSLNTANLFWSYVVADITPTEFRLVFGLNPGERTGVSVIGGGTTRQAALAGLLPGPGTYYMALRAATSSIISDESPEICATLTGVIGAPSNLYIQ